MILKLLLICIVVRVVELVTNSRNHGYQHRSFHSLKAQVYRTSTYPLQQEGEWEAEGLEEDIPDHPSGTVPSYQGEKDDSEAGNSQPRNGNWCSYLRSRLVTYIATCKKEKYVIKSQQPCLNGVPDCQKIMYRATLKPVYQVKQKVLNSLDWKCCPGYIGKDCKHYDPNVVPVPANQTGGLERDEEFSTRMSTVESEEIKQTNKNHEALLEDLQNDIHQTISNLGDLQRIFENNITTMALEADQNKSEVHERLLQQMLLPYVENFLKEHFTPMWSSFNKSLLNLSTMVRNLSQDVEANKKSIERFQESTVPKREFQELGTKFESKVQENVVKVEQLKRDIDNHLHLQQAAIHYNLTMIKADADMKFKRYHKIQQSHLLALNNSMIDLKQEQEKLEGDIEALNRNLTELSLYYGPKDDTLQLSIKQLNETLMGHAKQLKELYMDSDVAFEDITVLEKWINQLKDDIKHAAEDVTVSLMEKSLIMKENKEALERQILELNYTLSNLQESHWDLLKYMKECKCQKISSDIDRLEDIQKNISHPLNGTQLDLMDTKQLQTYFLELLRSEIELSPAFLSIHESLNFQQEKSRQLMDSMVQIESQVQSLSKRHEKIHGHIKYLNSSFNSLLEDAMRHETALEALLGEEIMDILSEEDPATLISPVAQLQEALSHNSDKLKEQNMTLEFFIKKLHLLEMNHENNHDAQNSSSRHPTDGKQIKNTLEEVDSQHGNVEHLEPSYEAAKDDILDSPAYNDTVNLKNDIKHLSREIKKHESWMDGRNYCCNRTVVSLVEPLSISMETLRADLATSKQRFEEHLQIFQKLFGTNEELDASNISLDITIIQSLLNKKMRQQLKGQDKQRKKDRQQTERRENMHMRNGRNTIQSELLRKDSSVAFYVGFSGGRDEGKTLRFNETYLNYGNCYFPEYGYFKAPHNGVYMFAVDVEFSPGPALGELLFSSGHRRTLSRSQKKTTNGNFMTTFAMAELKKGERVWFELQQGSLVEKSLPGATMGGFLIFKT
ncbi:PREDICTED: multimerin-2 [Crocodylus porosus]|uniref:multimerin-2 n=1 Tax=Crocodylus porosus TaxID=8502 RepID=UPI00093BE1AA|nr:PREDICTED: multimerin-2 [Crocodylus porosus]